MYAAREKKAGDRRWNVVNSPKLKKCCWQLLARESHTLKRKHIPSYSHKVARFISGIHLRSYFLIKKNIHINPKRDWKVEHLEIWSKYNLQQQGNTFLLYLFGGCYISYRSVQFSNLPRHSALRYPMKVQETGWHFVRSVAVFLVHNGLVSGRMSMKPMHLKHD